MKKIKTIILILIISFCSEHVLSPTTESLNSPTQSLLQAISIVDDQSVWISGHNGSFVRSLNGGKSWELFTHPTGDTLQFRDIHAFDESKVVLMSAGAGSQSRIFSFEAPGQWQENFIMEDSLGFLDCIDFWDEKNGIAYGDAIDKYPYILLTIDGGQSWRRADTTNMPRAGKGEGGFAASGTCVTTAKNGRAWIATGSGGNSRFLLSEDFGLSWRSVNSPLVKGELAGNTSVSLVENIGIVTGGDLLVPNEYTENCAFTTDGGLSWKLSNQPETLGAFYGGAITKVDGRVFAFACGPNGIDFTNDFGETWTNLDTLNYWAISIKEKTGYASGTDGKILRISLQ